MQQLSDAGIYLVLDVNNPLYSINRDDPEPSYNDVYLQSVFATIDEFAKYTNTLAFFSGNEVVNDQPATVKSAPYVKATTRDMRQYIGSRGYRKIPVGYSAADVSDNRMQTADYFNCGSDDERSDFFAFVSRSREDGILYIGIHLTNIIANRMTTRGAPLRPSPNLVGTKKSRISPGTVYQVRAPQSIFLLLAASRECLLLELDHIQNMYHALNNGN